MKEKWVVSAKRADFNGIGNYFGIDPVIARIMRNRNLTDKKEMEIYLRGTRADLHDPHLLKDVDLAADILKEKIETEKYIRIIGDYDIDGIMATYILLQGLRRLGAHADTVIPDRILDGYGLNEHLVVQANEAGVDTILTCDNGIAAISQIALAKSLGMTMIVTDHHEVPYEEIDGIRRQIRSEADAIVNPKQADCSYPFKGLCGGAVAFKLIQVLYERMGLPVEEADTFIEQAGFATVGDVMDLQGENRLLVKLGLERLNHTQNIGMKALILQNELKPGTIEAYHIGFRLGPCLNASGRLDTAKLSLKLLLCDQPQEAAVIAQQVVELNESRKLMTAHAVQEAMAQYEEKGYAKQTVLVIYLPECHESLAGIVAGRVREATGRPSLVVTLSEDGAKGSGRSIEAYNMFEELNKCKDLFTKFGGHPMAAGFSLPADCIEELRSRLNANSPLGAEDLIPKVTIDVPMPVDYLYEGLLDQLKLLEPFGKANEKPVFADKNLMIDSLRILGKEGRVVKMTLVSVNGRRMEAVYFGDPEKLRLSLEEKYGKVVADDTLKGRCVHGASLNFIYYPKMDHYYATPRLQLVIGGFCA